MRARPVVQPPSGPFLISARIVLSFAGLFAVALGGFNLLHEFHATFVDRNHAIAYLAVGIVWLVAIIVAFVGFRLGVFLAGAIAFVEYGTIAATHFETGAVSLTDFVKSEGLPLATVDMALLVACVLVVISAAVAYTNPRGRNHRLETLPLLVAALAGALLVILQATDDFHRTDFGAANPEDGAFAAAFLASLWLVGGFFIGRVRRTGALLIAVATFGVWYSFVTLHLVKGGITVSQIASRSGVVWAAIAAAAAILAAASFLLVLGLLAWSFVPGKRAVAPASQPVRKGA